MLTACNQDELIRQYQAYSDKGIKAMSGGRYRHARQYLASACQRLFELAAQTQGPLRQDRVCAAEALLRQIEQIEPSTGHGRSGDRHADQAPDSATNVVADDTTTRFEAVKVTGVKLDDVAGLDDVKQAIRRRLIDPVLNPEKVREFGLQPGGGILMYGPPGTGKTFLAKAVAGETDAEFFPVLPDDIMSKWVGDPERNVAELFRQARAAGRAVVFFDEIDALAVRRDDADVYMRRVVNQLLSEMQGFASSDAVVLVIGATNHPQLLDPAILRPGRFDELIEVPLPDVVARQALWRTNLVQRKRVGPIDVLELGRASEGYSGAEIRWLCDAGAFKALDRWKAGDQDACVEMRDLLNLMEGNPPRTTAEQVGSLRAWARHLGRPSSTPALPEPSSPAGAAPNPADADAGPKGDDPTKRTDHKAQASSDQSGDPRGKQIRLVHDLLEQRRSHLTSEQIDGFVEQLSRSDCDPAVSFAEIDHLTRRAAAETLVDQALEGLRDLPHHLLEKLRRKAFRRTVTVRETPTAASVALLVAALRDEIHRREAQDTNPHEVSVVERFEDLIILAPVEDFSDISGMEELKSSLDAALSNALHPAYREQYLAMTGYHPEAPQVLLYGAPGCGKTLFLNAVGGEYAQRYGLTVIQVPHHAILGKDWRQWLSSVVEVFNLAYRQSPCILLWDEFDVLVRNNAASISRHMVKVGYELRRQFSKAVRDHRHFIVNLAATNYPWRIDPAIIRPGRIGTVIHIPGPDRAARIGLIGQILSEAQLAEDADVPALADASDGMTCAEIVSCCKLGLTRAATRNMVLGGQGDGKIHQNDLLEAFGQRQARDFAAWLVEARSEMERPAFAGARRLFSEFLDKDLPRYLDQSRR